MAPKVDQIASAGRDNLAYVPLTEALDPAPPRAKQTAEDALLDGLLTEVPPARPAPREEPRQAPPVREPAPRSARATPPPREKDEEESEEVVDSGMSWGRQLFVEGVVFVVFGAGIYALDMAATIFGLIAHLLPATGIGLMIAGVIHVFISLGQRHYLRQGGWLILVGIGLLAINTYFNVYGIMPVMDALLGPDFLGAAVPRNPELWRGAVWSALWGSASLPDLWMLFWGGSPATPIDPTGFTGWASGATASWQITWPSWSLTAAVLVVTCGTLAWFSEIILLRLYRRVRKVWRRR